jgi:hypothetical protein
MMLGRHRIRHSGFCADPLLTRPHGICQDVLQTQDDGPKMGPKLRETALKYDNKCCELIENVRAGKVY